MKSNGNIAMFEINKVSHDSEERLFNHTGQWCWHPARTEHEPGFTLFRKKIVCNETLQIHIAVSADNRYNLYVDGQLIGRGPCRSDLQHYVYEEYTFSLDAGEHALTAEVIVWRPGWRSSSAPWSEIHCGGGFMVCGFAGETRLDTPYGWLTAIDTGRHPREWTEAWNSTITTPIPPMDLVDFSVYFQEWKMPDFDDQSWFKAIPLGLVCHRNNISSDPSVPWFIMPRQIKNLICEKTRIDAIVSNTGAELELTDGVLRGTIPAGRNRILLDIGRNQTSMVQVSGTGGNGTCRIAYAECLYQNNKKSDRNEIVGEIGENGYSDLLIINDRTWQYNSFWYRSGRFIELDCTLNTPMELHELKIEFFTYDFSPYAQFQSSDQLCLQKIWDVSLHTARCCAHEHYEDCPYYEQLQYVGDTRIQALISYAATGDSSLGLQAIRQFDWSRLYFGLTQSRYPNVYTQVIPGFSLIWILMIDDYYRYFGEKEVIAKHLDGVYAVLNYFEKHRNDQGLIDAVGYWNFTDWAGWPNGKSDRETNAPETIINLFYCEACRIAANFSQLLGSTEQSRKFLEQRELTKMAVNRYCFDPDAGIYSDVPGRSWFSSHVNALAIIADIATPDASCAIAAKLTDADTMSPCTLYFNFYIMEALKKVGNAGFFMQSLLPWRKMLELGFTTFPECPTPDTRSECHAWSASPVYEFITGLLGVAPDGPGFDVIRLSPVDITNLNISGQVPVGKGRWLEVKISDRQLSLCSAAELKIKFQYLPDAQMLIELQPYQTGNYAIEP